jgi:hypothetical protein
MSRLRLCCAVVALVAVTVASLGCSGGTGGTTVTPAEPAPAQATSSEAFDATNYAVLATDPDAHKGAQVDIVGRIFTAPEKDGSSTYIQMFADPKNSEWNTIVAYAGDLDVSQNDFVRVVGEVTGAFEGENALGGKVRAVQMLASSVVKVDATEAGPAPIRTAIVGKSAVQNGLTITVDKIEFTPDDARVYVTLTNGTKSKASFYSFGAKAVQGSTQTDAEFSSSYPEVQSELLPGVKSSGVVAFKKLDERQQVKLVFEARTEDYRADFKPYQFVIEP